MLSWREHKYQKLAKWGFTDKEAKEIGENYSMNDIRTLPYLKSMARWRRLYVSNLRSKGYSSERIANAIRTLYIRKQWIGREGEADIWEMIRSFRQKSIDAGEYFPRKRSHHKEISRRDLVDQASRRSRKSLLQKYAEGRGRE